MQKFKNVDEIISQLQPERPVYCIRKKSIHVASKTFQNKFPGKILLLFLFTLRPLNKEVVPLSPVLV